MRAAIFVWNRKPNVEPFGKRWSYFLVRETKYTEVSRKVRSGAKKCPKSGKDRMNLFFGSILMSTTSGKVHRLSGISLSGIRFSGQTRCPPLQRGAEQIRLSVSALRAKICPFFSSFGVNRAPKHSLTASQEVLVTVTGVLCDKISVKQYFNEKCIG